MKESGPTFFQLQFFVIGKEPTNQAKLHKCIQEINDRKRSMRNVELEIEELLDINTLHNMDIDRLKTVTAIEKDIKIRQIERKIKANELQIESLKKNKENWEEEIKFIQSMYDQISTKEQLKPWNNYDVQLEYWSEKIANEIKSRILMNSPVDIEVIKTAMSLPDQAPIKKQLLDHIDKKQLKE